MPDDAFDALCAQLDGAAPEPLRRLSAAELSHLANAIRTARRRQAKALAQAGESALGHIPRVLRGPVRKIVG
ncbi:MAG TPA: hypothetical protein VIK04_05735 [Solirubrobacteraceae bacterium]